MPGPGLQTTALVMPHIPCIAPRKQPVTLPILNVACRPGYQEWCCDCAEGRKVHPNLSLATGIMRQWIIADLPRGRNVALPEHIVLPPSAQPFRITLPDGFGGTSTTSAIAFFDLPVAKPIEVRYACLVVFGFSCPPPPPVPTPACMTFSSESLQFNAKSDNIKLPCNSCEVETLAWCTAWLPVAATPLGLPFSCRLIALIEGVEYSRISILSTRTGTLYKETGDPIFS
jgi:hypothetical protein